MSTGIGFDATPDIYSVPEETPAEEHGLVEVAPNRKLGFGGWFAVIWLALILFLAIFATFLPFILDFNTAYLDDASARPRTNGHLLGGDDNGHDELSNVVLGA